MEENKSLLNNDIVIDSVVLAHLKEAAGWAKFLGIAGFVMSGLVAIMGIGFGTFLSQIFTRYSYAAEGMGAIGGFMMVFYLIIAIVVFLVSRYLYLFAVKAITAVNSSDQEAVTAAFLNLKIYFRFVGVLTIIWLCFAVLAFLLGIIGLITAANTTAF